MRIAMVVHSNYPTDPRVRREAEVLAEAGHYIDVICLKDKKANSHKEVTGIRIYTIPVTHRRAGHFIYIFNYIVFFLLSMACLSFMHLRKRYHLIHIHNMPNFLVFTSLVPRLMGARVILDMHDPMPEIYLSYFKVPVDNWLVRLLRLEETVSCRYSNHLITVTEPMRELILQKGFDPRRVEVVMNLPDPSIFTRRDVKSTHSLDNQGRFTLIYTGLVSQRNGLDTAIEAVYKLKEEMPDLLLIIMGKGPQLPELEAMVENHGLQENVIFRDPVIIDEIPEILLHCEVGISPHHDNAFTKLMFSTKVAEYLSLDLPVISARTHTMEHYYDDSTLFFFEPGNADDFAKQVRLIRHRPDLVESRKMAGNERMRQLNWKEERKKFLKLVEDWGEAKIN